MTEETQEKSLSLWNKVLETSIKLPFVNVNRDGEMDNYNPYTGTMPVAAGSYGSFGGYGY